MIERAVPMRGMIATGNSIFAALLVLSLVLWSVVPSFAHTPAVFDTVQDHLQMIADHGHSHGFEEDLYWAVHGHSHDAADHDHKYAFLLTDKGTETVAVLNKTRLTLMVMRGPARQFRIDRPPRV